MESVIIKCGCKSDRRGVTKGAEFQDRTYGSGNRLASTGAKIVSRCSVCGNTIKK